MGGDFYGARFSGFALLGKVFFEGSEFFLQELFSLVNGTAAQGNANICVFGFKFSSEDVDAAGFVAAGTYHQADQIIELYEGIAFGALEVEMKGGVAFHEVPEVLLFVAWFDGGCILEDKTCGGLGAMKTFFHYNQACGDISHLPCV